MLQSMGSQRAGHDLVTEQQQQKETVVSSSLWVSLTHFQLILLICFCFYLFFFLAGGLSIYHAFFLQLSPFLLCWIYEVFIIPLFRFLSYTLYFYVFQVTITFFSPYKALSFFRTQGFLISDLPFPCSVFSSFHYPSHI